MNIILKEGGDGRLAETGSPLFWAKDHLQDLYVRLNELYPSRLSSAEVARLRSRTETVVSKAIHTFISESESRLKKNKGQGSF